MRKTFHTWKAPWRARRAVAAVAALGVLALSGSALAHRVQTSLDANVNASVDVEDTTPPMIKATLSKKANKHGWHRNDVTVSWTVTDHESAVTAKTGCEATTHTAETSGLTLTCTATSSGGTASKSVTLKIDKTAPVITIVSPQNGATYMMHQEVSADYSAGDSLSGIRNVKGTVRDGSMINTYREGEHIFRVGARDMAGNTATAMVVYTVEDDDDEDGDNDEDADEGDKDDRKVVICHKGWISLSISSSALQAHLSHGDAIGRCSR